MQGHARRDLDGRTKGESDTLFQYGQPPVAGKIRRPLTRAELEERERRLSLLSPHHVADAYRQAHESCRMEGDRLPSASAFQELVTVWKLLWKWKNRTKAAD
jgi:hypothetical protein